MTFSETSPGFPSTDLYLVCNATEEKIQIVAGAPDAPAASGPRPRQSRAGRRNPPFFASERAALGQGLCYVASDIAHALAGAGCPVSEAGARLRGIACVRGPGSFTGLRLILSSVLGLHKAWGTPLAGLDYLPLLARGAGAEEGELVWVLTHSRQRQVYTQGFRARRSTESVICDALAPPEALGIDAVADLLCAADAPCRVVGSGLRKNFDFFNERFCGSQQITFLPGSFDTPAPELLLQAAVQAEYEARAITPLYLRASDAEDNLQEIAKKHGFDPDAAARLLAKRTND